MPFRSARQTSANTVAQPPGGGINWSGAGSFFGSMFEGMGRENQLEAWKDYAKGNKESAAFMMQESEAQTAWDITRQRLVGDNLLGTARSAFGYAGVLLEGSAVDVLQEMEGELALDRQMTWREGQVAKQMYLRQYRSAKKAEKEAHRAREWNALSTTIGMFGSMFQAGAPAK